MAKHILLTVKEVSELYGISNLAIRMKIARGSLKAKKIVTNKKCGFEYRIDLQDLSETAKVRYYASRKSDSNVKCSDKGEDLEIGKTGKEYEKGKSEEDKNINDNKKSGTGKLLRKDKNIGNGVDNESKENRSDEIDEAGSNDVYDWRSLTDKQKKKAYLWEGILKAWREFVDGFEGKETEATCEFVKICNDKGEVKVSQRTLYRKWNLYKDKGLAALSDFRGKKANLGSDIPEEAWTIFSNWYLDINKPKVAFLYKALVYHFEEENPDILPLPSMATFRRAIESRIPQSVVTYYREGKKVWTDECAFYLRRDYSSLSSNDIWTSDYHTLDLFVKDDVTGEIYRPHLIIWSDIKSRKVLSMNLRRSSDSDGVFLSFRSAAIKYGVPEMVYFDNGREFLSSDIGGRGRRKTDVNSDYGKTLFERLGIKMINAKVANGRAKIAERQFNTMADQFSRMFETYCGNKPENRPEGHIDRIKDEKNIPLLSEIENELRDYIEGYYNNISSHAEGLEKGSPNSAYEKHLLKKRVISSDMLDILLLRTARLQTYRRNGVYVSIGSSKVYFYDSDITLNYLDRKVYVRYNPDDLSEVIIEDDKGRYVGKAKRAIEGGYGLANDTESIKYLSKTNKKLEKMVRDYKKVEQIIDVPSVREVISKKSKKLLAGNKDRYFAKVIEPILNNSEYKAVGAEDVNTELIDFGRMIDNARKNKK